jgi:hypothetical protein
MRSSHLFVLLALSSGCATAAIDDDVAPEQPGDDAAAAPHADAGSSTAKDAGFSLGNDSGGTTTEDAGNTVSDSGNTNNGCTSFQGTLATFDFTGEPGNQTSTAPTSTASGVTAGAISRASSLTATSGQDSINASAWATTTKLDTSRYYTFTLTPSSPCTLDVSSLSITTKASSTGPASAAVATSDDAFAKTTTFAPNVTATPALSVNGATGAVEIRVYGYDASGAGGTMRVDTTLTVAGSLQ